VAGRACSRISDRARLKLILRGKRVGFSLEEIKEMLDLYNLRDGQLTQLRVASTKMRERLSALQTQRVELDHAIEDLERTVEIMSMACSRNARRAATSRQQRQADQPQA
jgi:DNA-binding transcriptional MerR regulator